MRVKRRVWRMHSSPSSTQRDVSYHSAVDSTGHCLRFGFLVNGKIKRNARRIQEKKNARKVLAIRRNSPQRRAHTSAMVSNSESNANTPSSSRVVTPSHHSDAREADYDVFGRVSGVAKHRKRYRWVPDGGNVDLVSSGHS